MVELNHNNREVKRPDDVPWRTKMDEPEFYAKVDARSGERGGEENGVQP